MVPLPGFATTVERFLFSPNRSFLHDVMAAILGYKAKTRFIHFLSLCPLRLVIMLNFKISKVANWTTVSVQPNLHISFQFLNHLSGQSAEDF